MLMLFLAKLPRQGGGHGSRSQPSGSIAGAAAEAAAAEAAAAEAAAAEAAEGLLFWRPSERPTGWEGEGYFPGVVPK